MRKVRAWFKSVRRRWLSWSARMTTGALMLLPGAAALMAYAQSAGGVVADVAAMVAVGSFLSLVFGTFLGSVRRETEVAIDEEEGTVTVAGETLRAAQVASGFLTAMRHEAQSTPPSVRDGWEVRLRLSDGRELRLGLEDRADALAVLRLMGVDGSRKRLVLPRRKSGTVVLTLFVSMIALPFIAGIWAGAAVTLPPFAALISALAPLVWLYPRVFWWTLMKLQPSDVVVGHDGTRTAEGFLPHHRVRGVDVQGDEVVLETDAGEWRIPMGPVAPELRVALQERIEALMTEPAAPSAPLARGDEDTAAWIARMKKLLATDYRDAGVPAHKLREVLEDGRATAAERVGAAVALMAKEEERPRLRVRVAELAESVADEDLERAFEELAKGELKKKTAEAL